MDARERTKISEIVRGLRVQPPLLSAMRSKLIFVLASTIFLSAGHAIAIAAPPQDDLADLGHVANNAALKALPPAAHTRILRDGFARAGDGGAAVYTWTDTVCSAPDNGAQVAPNGGSGCWVADFSVIRPSVKIWGAKGDCKNDDSAAIKSALDTHLRIHLPQGNYLLGASISTNGYYNLQGEGWTEQGLSQAPCSHSPGSYLVVTDPTVSPFTLNGDGANASRFSDLAVLQAQAPPAPGWQPTVYPPIWTIDGAVTALAGVRFTNIGLGAVYAAINAVGNAARIELDAIYGQIFAYLLRVEDAQDVSRASNVHLWNYWSACPACDYVFAWQQANGVPFLFLRQDSFQAENIFVFGYKACVQLSENAIPGQLPGPPTAIHFGNLNCDAVKYAIWVDPVSIGAVAAVDHLWVGGETCCTAAAPIPGSNAVQIDGQAATIDINDIHLTAVDQSAVNITNRTKGSIVRLGSIDASGGMNYRGRTAFAGASPIVNAIAVPRGESEVSLLHPVQPQNAGYAGGGVSSGIINQSSDAILYARDRSWFKLDIANGGSYRWPNWAETLIADISGTIGAATIALPASALDGRQISLECAGAITRLTIKAIHTVKNPPGTCIAGRRYEFKFTLPDMTWWAFQ